MWFSILSGIVAFVLWWVTDTRLDPNHFRNSKGEITFWGIVSLVVVQIFLWTLAGLFAAWIVPHLPDFFLAGWRFPITLFCSLFLQWFSLLMILQYVWTIVRPTLNTASVVVMAKVRIAMGETGARQRAAPFRSSGSGTEGAGRTT